MAEEAARRPGGAPGARPADENSIRVIARFRPMNRLEKEEGGKQVVSFQGDTQLTQEPVDAASGRDRHTFSFDHVFGPDSTQQAVYDQVGKAVVADVFKGYNGTIFVYGQTGSGKSHTMMGPNVGEVSGYCDDETQKGIIPRVVDQIFVNVEKADPQIEFAIKVSYVEIYMEKVRDLFNPEKSNLQLHEDFKGGRGVYIQNVTEEWVATPDEIFALMRQGASNRAVASTRMNADSSRSHSIFTLAITQKHSVKLDQVTGKLFLVDLAGSEKVGKTQAAGQQLEEAKLINKSLSCLGSVINALTDRKSQHVPYRDSKLTRLLQDSLGGNARTSLIICCSPSEYNQHETLSTLRFGQRAKSIKNKAKVNRELSIGEYKLLVARLERTISELRAAKGLPSGDSVVDAAAVEQIANLEAQLENERSRWLDDRTELLDELQEAREREGAKDLLFEQYRKELALYQEEVSTWEQEFEDMRWKAEELQAALDRERRAGEEKLEAIAEANSAVDQFGKDILGVKVTLQKLRQEVDQQGPSAGAGLDAAQQQQVAEWRQERARERSAEDQLLAALRERLEDVGKSERASAARQAAEIDALRAQLAAASRPCWVLHCVEGAPDPADETPSDPAAMQEEIRSLRRACAELRQGGSVPQAAHDAARAAFASSLEQAEGLRAAAERRAQESEELRAALLGDLQTRCERVADLELALADARDQYQQLMAASSSRQLRKRVKQYEELQERQTEMLIELMNQKATLENQVAFIQKKLDIRTQRAANLDEHRREQKELFKQQEERWALERVKHRQELQRAREEMHYWKERAAAREAGARATPGGSMRVVKVLRGGMRQPHHDPAAPCPATPQQPDLAATSSSAG
eukprot:TRINITY_DN6140_c0_g1_i1.p1 TRINITY_DN6140_c0_g1~~TRINITY_DN6140_c0_g1_i1.p1  ORF type:complete len:892 (+),score=375.29 TRINITY_DN6140_c0_g1_i1:78-2678(+)